MKHCPPHILLINPWITDFAAYNLWIKPYGILSIASLLRINGFRVTFIDCLDSTLRRKSYGDGKFHKIEIEKPLPLKRVPRKYSQYGIPEELFRKKLSGMERPDLIGITSGMTYWYPGLFKSIRIVREFFEGVPILLGGIYATLCYEHAVRYSEADAVFKGGSEWDALELISELIGLELHGPSRRVYGNPERNEIQGPLPTDIYPAFELYPHLHYVVVMTSRGCPLRCSYCASPILSRGFERRDPIQVVEEIEYWTNRYKVCNIAFYDDALLANPFEHIILILREIKKRGIECNFHAPNGLHVKEISEELAALLYHCRFKTIRLGLETSNEAIQIETGGKVDNRSFSKAVKNLKGGGYSENEIGVYIMAGLPGQRVGEVEESVAFVKENGAKPMLVEYSPIPQTSLFERARQMSEFDIENEPLCHNNSILPCQWEGFTYTDFQRLKKMVRA